MSRPLFFAAATRVDAMSMCAGLPAAPSRARVFGVAPPRQIGINQLISHAWFYFYNFDRLMIVFIL